VPTVIVITQSQHLTQLAKCNNSAINNVSRKINTLPQATGDRLYSTGFLSKAQPLPSTVPPLQCDTFTQLVCSCYQSPGVLPSINSHACLLNPLQKPAFPPWCHIPFAVLVRLGEAGHWCTGLHQGTVGTSSFQVWYSQPTEVSS